MFVRQVIGLDEDLPRSRVDKLLVRIEGLTEYNFEDLQRCWLEQILVHLLIFQVYGWTSSGFTLNDELNTSKIFQVFDLTSFWFTQKNESFRLDKFVVYIENLKENFKDFQIVGPTKNWFSRLSSKFPSRQVPGSH